MVCGTIGFWDTRSKPIRCSAGGPSKPSWTTSLKRMPLTVMLTLPVDGARFGVSVTTDGRT